MLNFARLCGVVILLFVGGCVTTSSLENAKTRIPMIDAHSQASKYIDLDDVIPLMNKAEVTRTLLSARRGLNWREISAFARFNPARITASVRTKVVFIVIIHQSITGVLRSNLMIQISELWQRS